MFRKCQQTSLRAASNSSEESVVHALPTLFRTILVFLAYCHMSSLRIHLQMAMKLKMRSPFQDTDLDNIVGVGDNSYLEERDPPSTLQCELRPYQRQALHWMIQLEKGPCMDEAGTTLHPCWNAYRLADKRELVIYLNAFTGDATTEFPSTLKMARGGILADAMGLGKTIMTIALLLAHSEKDLSKKAAKFSGFHKLKKQENTLTSGGNLIICPMTLLGQWKAEIETHAQPGSLSVYVHYGQGRLKDAKILAQNDVVITTYGVLASEFSPEHAEDNGGLYSVHWFRVVLDEAHTIKSSKSQISMAAAALIADRRWCLTGTPIQNNLEDIYSLLRFLRVEPWGNWAWWNKLIQKPFDEGDERGLKLVQSILKPIMLRRTKFSTDREGRPILVLPPADIQVIYCELTSAEKDFYEALFKRSKVKFDQFVEQGRCSGAGDDAVDNNNDGGAKQWTVVLIDCLHRQEVTPEAWLKCRGDTQEFSDLNKLAKHFLKGGQNALEGETKDLPSRAYIQEVVEELRKGEQGECPICLEAFEDAVLTPCAHCLCESVSWLVGEIPLLDFALFVGRPSVGKILLQLRLEVDSRLMLRKLDGIIQSCCSLARTRKSLLCGLQNALGVHMFVMEIPVTPDPRSNISFVRLDGTLNQQQREKVIKQFSEESNILVLLMSLKAGGVGINLTAASNAFVLDPWWNPAVEEQAVMRIHRIGQTKRVMIKRFIVKGTVEEKMLAVQARKQRMISGALTDQEVRSARIEELKMLFT
ncbi:DNA repair protein RAD5A [Vitis vinifera]|uniref:DNA repair protein RAD5A n=1 Tax=Vitis vinifera TaxID=29760 RepID=A0A438KFK6_VITVI|nr:DNA repair protein RAD5A [Vitis vinifera]